MGPGREMTEVGAAGPQRRTCSLRSRWRWGFGSGSVTDEEQELAQVPILHHSFLVCNRNP